MFGVAVNHFWRIEHPISVLQSTKFAISLLRNCVEVTTIVVIDSSDDYNLDLDNFCQDNGVIYRHYHRTLSFPEAYNFGVACLTEDWVVTMASDIYVRPETFTLFKEFIDKNPEMPIGCLIPYLSSCDYVVQEASQNAVKQTCYSGMMTYNLNVFPKSVFQQLGGLSNKYSGNFNDAETSIRLKAIGLKIILVDNFVLHYGRLTLQHGTNVKAYADLAQFQLDHPEFMGNPGLYQVRLDQFLDHPILKLAFKASLVFRPRRFRQGFERWVYRRLPILQRVDT